MKVLVTGITGFVGSHLAEHLLAHGDQVAGCSRRGEWPGNLSHLARCVRLVQCDLCDPPSAVRLLDGENFDWIVHLAGLADPRACRANPQLARRENTEAAGNLCEAIRRSGGHPRVLFVSTAFVYGRPRPEDLPIRTDCPLRADEPYGTTKLAAEQVCQQYVTEHGLDIIRVRAFNHTGPRQPAGYAIPDWAMQIVEMEEAPQSSVLRVGNLQTRRDYTDVRDVVRAYRLLCQKAAANAVYNLGSGVSRSGREILDLLRRLSRVDWSIESDPSRMRADEAAEVVADTTPLRQLTGWKPEIDLETTLRDTLNFWRN